jgi:hypothetical protein
VCLDNPDKNVDRVLGRSQAGGHSASEDQIRETYDQSLKNLSYACKEFDQIVGFDNSGECPRLIFEIQNRKLNYLNKDAPAWAIESLERAELINEQEFKKYQISIIVKDKQSVFTHKICVPSQEIEKMSTNELASFLDREAKRYAKSHPVLSQMEEEMYHIQTERMTQLKAQSLGLGEKMYQGFQR